MRKKIFFTVFISILLTACKKDSADATNKYYIKATIDGTRQTFSKNAKAVDFFGDFTNTLTLSADISANQEYNSPAISLTLNHGYTSLTTGTFLQGVYNPTASVYSIFGTYKSYAAGSNSQASPPLKITITQVDDKTITGTFEGQYFDTTLALPSVIIGNGEFYLPFK